MEERKKRNQYEFDKRKYDHIHLQVPKGAKERIVEAATATGQSTNGFIRSSLNEAVERATGRPMEVSEGNA